VKKIIPLLLVGLIAMVLVRRQRSAKAEADLWREATTPTTGRIPRVRSRGRSSTGRAPPLHGGG
jgi:hypothetical protein